MSTTSLAVHPHAVKHGRFVAPTAEAQAELEREFDRQIGRNLYKRGRPFIECEGDDMKAGYLAAARNGKEAYHRCMTAAEQPVNWRGEFVEWNDAKAVN